MSAQAEEKFEKVGVYLEQNLRDKDAEVKFEAIAGNTGLATLNVTAPDGRTVIDFITRRHSGDVRVQRAEIARETSRIFGNGPWAGAAARQIEERAGHDV